MKGSPVKRTLQRLLVTLTVSGGLLAFINTAAEALSGANHSEPVARDHQ